MKKKLENKGNAAAAAAKATMRNEEINGTQSLTFIWVCKMVRKTTKKNEKATINNRNVKILRPVYVWFFIFNANVFGLLCSSLNSSLSRSARMLDRSEFLFYSISVWPTIFPLISLCSLSCNLFLRCLIILAPLLNW